MAHREIRRYGDMPSALSLPKMQPTIFRITQGEDACTLGFARTPLGLKR